MFWRSRRINFKFLYVLKQKSLNIPSRQHKLNDEYYDRVEAIQFTIRHDDGNETDDMTIPI